MSRPCLDIRFLQQRSICLTPARLTQSRAVSRLRTSIPSPYPAVESCPEPTCECRPMPEGLDIDTKQPLNGTIAPYAEQILICTGKADWTSRIEDDEVSYLARGLKAFLGRAGKFSDPYHNVMITNASFTPLASTSAEPKTASAYLFPSFKFLPEIPLDRESLEDFVRGYVLPTELHRAHDEVPDGQRRCLLRDPASQTKFRGVRDVTEALILICGHGGRDARCGILGSLLKAEFEDKARLEGYTVSADTPHSIAHGEGRGAMRARVGLISHIGGHKYAGNVILYVPPAAKHALAGCGIWYGRVRPEHVEGIVHETLVCGRIVRAQFRGGIDQNGNGIML